MTIVAAIMTHKIAVAGSDSRTFISGAGSNSVVDGDGQKIIRIRFPDSTTSLLAFAGHNKFQDVLVALLVMYRTPKHVPPDEWPDEGEDESYAAIYLCADGLWKILGKSEIVQYPLPCYATIGSGADVASGSIETQTWRRKSLAGLTATQAQRIIRNAIRVTCKVDITCGGRIRIAKI